LTNSIRGQDEKRKFIYLETGIDGISCVAPDKFYLRSVSDQSSYDDYTDKIKALMTLEYLGIKIEYRIANNLFGVSSGLRYTRMIASIVKSSYNSNAPDFFYVNFNQDGMNTEYAKVRELKQNTSYLGIPLELRYYPKKERRIRLYYKAGVSFNLQVGSKSDIAFVNAGMEPYRNDVLKVVEKASPYYTTFHLGLGLKVGKFEKPGICIEAYAPIGVIFPDNSYFVYPIAGGGIQIMARIPIK
jgi:hypothetical protein